MKKTSILFIGNSFTYFSDMPHAIFAKICDATNVPVFVESVTTGGYKLVDFCNSEDEFGKQVYKAFETKKYDIVILQEQSMNAITGYDEFFHGVETLANMAKNNGAKVYLYSTWGYKEGYELLPLCGKSTREMAEKMYAAYSKAANDVGGYVAPVGNAFLDVYENCESINLYDNDLYHPSLYGSIVAAWVIFSTIFGISPEKVNYNCNISDEECNVLKKAAHIAVFGK